MIKHRTTIQKLLLATLAVALFSTTAYAQATYIPMPHGYGLAFIDSNGTMVGDRMATPWFEHNGYVYAYTNDFAGCNNSAGDNVCRRFAKVNAATNEVTILQGDGFPYDDQPIYPTVYNGRIYFVTST